MLTRHDIGGNDSVCRPTVLCCFAHIDPNCDNESGLFIPEQSEYGSWLTAGPGI